MSRLVGMSEVVIRPRRGWQTINFGEIWQHRELFAFLVWRDIQIRYRQTLLGFFWAVLQPLVAMVIFTVLFNRLAGIESDGAPYPLFAYSGLVAWTFFTNAVGASSNSLIGNQQLISKVYFPRLFIPLASVVALAMDMLLNLILVGGLMVYFQWPVSTSLVWLPVFVLGAIVTASGLGLILSALNVQFRDVKYAVPFFIQMGLFTTPVIYPLQYVPERYHAILAFNPMAGIVEGFRHALLGTPMNWGFTGISITVSTMLGLVGVFVFRRIERHFADVI